MSHPQEGDILAGKYRIDRVLGVGGMGMVVSALHLQLHEQVAIKFLLPVALANPEAVARFAREARAAVKIKSEHIARVADVGALEGGAPYMVMELLRGSDLSVALHEGGPLPPWLAALYVLQACEAKPIPCSSGGEMSGNSRAHRPSRHELSGRTATPERSRRPRLQKNGNQGEVVRRSKSALTRVLLEAFPRRTRVPAAVISKTWAEV